MNKIKKKIWRVASSINKWIERCSAFIHLLIIALVMFVSTQAIAFCTVYLQLLNEEEIFMQCFKYINIWGILSAKPLTSNAIYDNFDSVKIRIEFLMNVSIALSGLLLSLVTFISYFRKNVEIRRKSCFRKQEIFETGKDDVKIMCEYFRGANFVAIYSHSFSWVDENNEIKTILTDLANKNKLRLFTGDNINSVKRRLKNCESKLLDCIFETKLSLRFSYVERNDAKYLLYRQEEESHTYVITVYKNSESQYLLQVISCLVK